MKSFVKVPQPCHESWSKMEEAEKGRHCKSCSTVVIDFTKMGDQELRIWFKEHKGESFCGHFKSEQVERNHIVIKRKELITNRWSPTQIARIAIFIVFFSSLFSCKPANDNDNRHIELSIEPDTELVMNIAIDSIIDLDTTKHINTVDIKKTDYRKSSKPNMVLGEVMIEDVMQAQEREHEVLTGIPVMDYDELELDTNTEIQGKVVGE